jgi:hypothetical protein
MTRFWPEGMLIAVVIQAAGLPLRFEWQGQVHQVETIARQWRVDVGWWRVRIWRDYFKLTTDSGLLVIIYHELLTKQWYLQRLYD